MNIYKINFIPLLIISLILFILKILTCRLFNNFLFDELLNMISFFYYFLLHPGLLLWNLNHSSINKYKINNKNIILILLSIFLGYVLYFTGMKIFTGELFGGSPESSIIYLLIIVFDIIMIFVVGMVELIKANRNDE